jgi:hypothetical protein
MIEVQVGDDLSRQTIHFDTGFAPRLSYCMNNKGLTFQFENYEYERRFCFMWTASGTDYQIYYAKSSSSTDVEYIRRNGVYLVDRYKFLENFKVVKVVDQVASEYGWDYIEKDKMGYF